MLEEQGRGVLKHSAAKFFGIILRAGTIKGGNEILC